MWGTVREHQTRRQDVNETWIGIFFWQVCGKWKTGKLVDNYNNMDVDYNDDNDDGEIVII